jgi:hypothetical protein
MDPLSNQPEWITYSIAFSYENKRFHKPSKDKRALQEFGNDNNLQCMLISSPISGQENIVREPHGPANDG